MRRSAILLLTTLSALSASCQIKENQVWAPTARVSAVVAESYDAEISGPGYSLGGDTEYRAVDLAVGTQLYEVQEDGSRVPVELIDLVIGRASFGDADATEVSAGGRFYIPTELQKMHPFVSIYSVTTALDDLDGISSTGQLGLRVGGGVAYFFSENAFVDLGIDYTVPLIAAETETFPAIDIELDGMALRLGVGLSF